jgi:SPP1 family predicted phage head-tail adaptor
MKAGRLNQLITIETPTTTLTASGDKQTTWATFATVYGSVQGAKVQEQWDAESVFPLITHQVILRYLAGVTSDMRLRVGSRVLHIEGPPINPAERNIELHLLCIEKT